MAVKNPKAEAKTDAVASAGFSAYIGPSIVGVMQTATIFPVGREDALNLPEVKLALAKAPGIADLLVDGATLPQDSIKVKTPEEPLYKAYRALLNT